MSAWTATLPEGQSTWDSQACVCRPVVSPVLGLVEEQFAAGFLGHSFTSAGGGHAPFFQDIDGQAYCSRASSSSFSVPAAGLSRGATCSSTSPSSDDSPSSRRSPASSNGASSMALLANPILHSEEDTLLLEAAGQAPPLPLTKSYSSPELTAYTSPVVLHQGLYTLVQHGSRRSMEDDPEAAAWRHLTMQEMLPPEYASSCSGSGHGISWARSLVAASSTYGGSSSLAGSGLGSMYACESSSGDDSTDSSAGCYSARRSQPTPSRLARHNTSSCSSASKPLEQHSTAAGIHQGDSCDMELVVPCRAMNPVAEASMAAPGKPPRKSLSSAHGAEAAGAAHVPPALTAAPGGTAVSCGSVVAAAAAPGPASGRGMLAKVQRLGREMREAARQLGDQLEGAAVGVWDAGTAAAHGLGKRVRRGAARSSKRS